MVMMVYSISVFQYTFKMCHHNPIKLWTYYLGNMKNLLLLWLLIYVITGNLAFAEKAMSPVLLAPTNFAKNISKDRVKDILILQNIDIVENLPKTLPLFCIRINKLKI